MEDNLIKTLSYFDIFDYPLTFSEIKKFTDYPHNISDEELDECISSISVIQETNGYYYLLGRNEIVEKRNERAGISLDKLAKAKVIAKFLTYIPTIEYIGISGSLSMNNAGVADDIDLFIVTKKKSLWFTRMIVNSVLILTHQKRDRNGNSIRDKICPNMFVDSEKLAFTAKRKTLYTAHEIVHLKTLFDRNNTYEKLLLKNKWISSYFPHFEIPKPNIELKVHDNALKKLISKAVSLVDRGCFLIQKKYMQKNITNEVLTDQKAFFHPIDRQKIILDLHKLRTRRYLKLLDENLWVDKDEARFYMEEKKIRILN